MQTNMLPGILQYLCGFDRCLKSDRKTVRDMRVAGIRGCELKSDKIHWSNETSPNNWTTGCPLLHLFKGSIWG